MSGNSTTVPPPTPEELAASRQGSLIAVSAAGLAITYLAVLLRMVCRHLTRKRWAKDDWLIMFALLPTTGMHVSTIIAEQAGMGAHISLASDPVTFAKCATSIQICYAIATMITKISILFFYVSLFPFQNIIRASWFTGIIVALYSIALVLITALRCIPFEKLWSPKTPGYCLPAGKAYLTLAIVNVITDFMILVIPVRSVWRLHLHMQKRLVLVGIFLLGGIVCIFGIIRSTRVNDVNRGNITYTGSAAGIWSQAELSVGIVCACLPIFGPLFQKSLRATSRDASYASSKQSNGSHVPPMSAARKDEFIEIKGTKAGGGVLWPKPKKGQGVELKPLAKGSETSLPDGAIRVDNEVQVLEHDVDLSHPEATLPPRNNW